MSVLFYFDFSARGSFGKYYSLKKYKMVTQMYPCLWFDGQAKAAAAYYCSIFKDSKITAENPIVVNVELNGNKL